MTILAELLCHDYGFTVHVWLSGIPGVIVAVSLGVKNVKQFYGVTTMTMADTNQTNAMWVVSHISLQKQ